jgi:hypothetical protein
MISKLRQKRFTIQGRSVEDSAIIIEAAIQERINGGNLRKFLMGPPYSIDYPGYMHVSTLMGTLRKS